MQKELDISQKETERAVNTMRDTQFRYDRLEVRSPTLRPAARPPPPSPASGPPLPLWPAD